RAELLDEQGHQDGADDDREDDGRKSEVEERDLVQEDEQIEELEEEDVPGRAEVLDPQEPDDRCQISSSLLADGVIAARVEWVATTDALRAHPRAAKQRVALDRLIGVHGTRRRIAAARRHPG